MSNKEATDGRATYFLSNGTQVGMHATSTHTSKRWATRVSLTHTFGRVLHLLRTPIVRPTSNLK